VSPFYFWSGVIILTVNLLYFAWVAMLPAGMYTDYLQGRALEALQRYREENDLEALEEMQFFMHRITHQVIKNLEESVRIHEAMSEAEKLKIMSDIYEGYDG